MALWTGHELNRILGCTLLETLNFHGVSIDSRTAHTGDLFFAIKGPYSDGHSYIQEAFKKGCTAAVVSEINPSVPKEFPQILLKDTLAGLVALATEARARTNAHIIAITGSVGKTSTKEMLRHVLSAYGKVSYSVASYNNHWGVPLSLARLPSDATYGVFEVGMNNSNEIAPLSQLIRPHMAIITNISPAHIGHLGSMSAIAEEKSYLFSGLVAGGVALIPTDTPFKSYLYSRARAFQAETILTFGSEEDADYRLLTYENTLCDYGGQIRAYTPSQETSDLSPQEISYTLSIPGKHQAFNSLMVLAVVQTLNLPLSPTLGIFSTLTAVKGRGIIHKILVDKNRRIILIDDSYNANLVSLKAALELLITINPQEGGRRLVVLGEMKELGFEANDHHQEISETINSHPIECAYYVGDSAIEHGFSYLTPEKQGVYVKKVEDLLPSLIPELKNNDVLLIKGSKSTRVSLLVEHLLTLGYNTHCDLTK